MLFASRRRLRLLGGSGEVLRWFLDPELRVLISEVPDASVVLRFGGGAVWASR